MRYDPIPKMHKPDSCWKRTPKFCTQILLRDIFPMRNVCSACARRSSVAGERLDTCAKSKAIDLSPTSPASGLPLLKARWLEMKPKLERLRRPGDGGALDSVMDLVYEIEQQTNTVCGNPEGPDQVLLLLSQDRAGAER